MSKKFILLFLLLFLFPFVSAITTLNTDVVNPSNTIKLTIKPTNAGFYNIINVHDADDDAVVGVIVVNCATICTKKNNKVNYVVPGSFFGGYYFATFDYGINDYELDTFSVIPPEGAPSGSLTIQEVRNTNAGTNTLVNPEQGKNSSVTFNVELNINSCQTYSLNGYFCNKTIINSCSNTNFTNSVPLNFISRQGNRCTFSYVGEDYFPFYQPGGEWKAVARSGVLRDELNFTYTSLTAINYSSVIDFGQLNANVWNVGIPAGGIDMINFGNVPMLVDWRSDGFACISQNCTDFWSLFVEGEDLFQLDDDDLFFESNETGLLPVFITNYTLNYFPPGNLSTCISSSCNDSIGERTKTHFNLKIPDIQRGVYEGDITITLS
jgi:hypothetical protein